MANNGDKAWHKWLGNNAWGIVVALIGVVVVFTAMQSQVKANEARIDGLEEKVDIIITQNQTMLIEQAETRKDIEFIKLNLTEHSSE